MEGTRKIEWRDRSLWIELVVLQNQPMPVETYLLSEDYYLEHHTVENQKIVVNIFQRLQNDEQRPGAIRDLETITQPLQVATTTTTTTHEYARIEFS